MGQCASLLGTKMAVCHRSEGKICLFPYGSWLLAFLAWKNCSMVGYWFLVRSLRTSVSVSLFSFLPLLFFCLVLGAVTPTCAQGLLLPLHWRITPGGTIGDSGSQTHLTSCEADALLTVISLWSFYFLLKNNFSPERGYRTCMWLRQLWPWFKSAAPHKALPHLPPPSPATLGVTPEYGERNNPWVLIIEYSIIS